MTETRLWLLAIVCFVACALVGALVSSRPPMRLDVDAYALRGTATPLALFFTALGRWYVLLPLALVAAAVTAYFRGNVLTIVVLFGSQILAQGANTLLKYAFDRTRPAHPLLPESDLSFPSGHAVTAIVFYAGLLVLIARTGVVPRSWSTAFAVVLGACVIGIPWSRLALGAHYLTDVAGGILFGCGWLCATTALAYRFAQSSRINA